jgi:hypothetical protein
MRNIPLRFVFFFHFSNFVFISVHKLYFFFSYHIYTPRLPQHTKRIPTMSDIKPNTIQNFIHIQVTTKYHTEYHRIPQNTTQITTDYHRIPQHTTKRIPTIYHRTEDTIQNSIHFSGYHTIPHIIPTQYQITTHAYIKILNFILQYAPNYVFKKL